MRSRTHVRPAVIFALAAAVLTAVAGGCAEAGSALGGSPAEARRHADELFFAIGSRFGPVEQAEGFAEIRSRFSRSALVPSRLFDDSTVWTSMEGERRVLRLAGQPRPAGYLLGFRDLSRLTGRPGDYRRTITLDRLSAREYEWTVSGEVVAGSVSPDELGAALTALYRTAERVDPERVRAGYRAALPRTTRSLGRLFTVDSILLAPAPHASTRVTLQMTLHPDRIEEDFPDFARFLERYVTRTRFDVMVEDPDSVPWWRAQLAANRLTLDLMLNDGKLAPLVGPPRPMPERMRTRVDAVTRVRIFGVGFSGLRGDVLIRRTPREKSFTVFFTQEPNWNFPLLVEHFIRAPLRRPFAGEGAELSLSVRRSGSSTSIVRDYRVAVEESAIVRWIGGLGSTALGDFRQRAEEQAEQFIGEVFTALRQDAGELIR